MKEKNATVLPDNRWNQKKKSFCDPYFFLDLIAVSFFNKKLGFMIDFVPQMSSPGSRVGEGTWLRDHATPPPQPLGSVCFIFHAISVENCQIGVPFGVGAPVWTILNAAFFFCKDKMSLCVLVFRGHKTNSVKIYLELSSR